MNNVVRHQERGGADESRTSVALAQSLQQAREALLAAGELAHAPELVPPGGLDLRNAVPAINIAERTVTKCLTEQASVGGAQSQFIDVLVQLSAVRSAISEANLANHTAAVTEINDALRQLDSVTSVQQLVQLVPRTVSRLGYHRALFSRVKGEKWIARSAHAHSDSALARSMIEVGSAAPGTLERNAPEGHVASKRVPVLVKDPQSRPEVHPELKTLIQTHAYVSAPVVVNDRVIGLLHADEIMGTGEVDELDRDFLGLFAEGLGCVFERTSSYERLASLQHLLEAETNAVADVVNGFVDDDAVAPLTARRDMNELGAQYSTVEPSRETSPSGLTQRELEVLGRLASGERNAQIATRLYVSEGTVKTHVKSILRKLGAENRAQAVALYHSLDS